MIEEIEEARRRECRGLEGLNEVRSRNLNQYHELDGDGGGGTCDIFDLLEFATDSKVVALLLKLLKLGLEIHPLHLGGSHCQHHPTILINGIGSHIKGNSGTDEGSSRANSRAVRASTAEEAEAKERYLHGIKLNK